jgi:cytochrome c oxidase subunit 1
MKSATFVSPGTVAEPGAPVEVPVNTGANDAYPRENYLTNGYGWQSWLFTLDHKRIGILYLISITLMFVIGGAAAGLVRYNLLAPQGLLGAEDYNRAFTAHGAVMVFFFLIPSIPAVMGNFLIPLMIGAKDLAFPKLNLLSWYLYLLGGTITLWALIYGGVETGWTFYAPYSSVYANGNVVWAVVGIFIAGFSSILTGLNFIVTIHKMRAPGLTWFRLPAVHLVALCGEPDSGVRVLRLSRLLWRCSW